MLELWSNFVTHLDPTPAGLDSDALHGVDWEPVTEESHQYLRWQNLNKRSLEN